MKALIGAVFAMLLVISFSSQIHASCPGNWGDSLGSYKGVTAYSNGSNPGCWVTNGSYLDHQCVAYVKRFYSVEVGDPITTNWGEAQNAFFYSDAGQSDNNNLLELPQGGGAKPKPGDILCFGPKAGYDNVGHVAVIYEVGSNYVRMIDQNRSTTNAKKLLPMSAQSPYYITAFDSAYVVQGWLRDPNYTPSYETSYYRRYPPADSTIKMLPGQTISFIVAYRNDGSTSWENSGYPSNPDYVELRSCNSSGTETSSWIHPGNGWISSSRVTPQQQANVNAGQNAWFNFTGKVPVNATPGTSYHAYFRPWHAAGGFFQDWGSIYFNILVVSAPVPPPAAPPQQAFGLILRNPEAAQWWIRPSNDSAFVYPVGANWPPDLWLSNWAQDDEYTFVPYAGDLDGDSYDDLIVERSDCNWYVAWNNQDGSFTEQGTAILAPWGTSPSPGKYFFWFVNVKGDAKDELLTYDASNGNWYVSSFNTSNHTYDSYSTWITWGSGIGTYQPIVGDWDGDGDTDICLRNPSTGNHYVRLSNGSNAFVQGTNDNWLGSWGASSAFTPLVGDWSGDGKDDICLFNASNGDHYVRLSNGSSFYQGTNDNWLGSWTGSGYIPFVGDFNDDGKTDLGLRNPELGDHWVRLSTGSVFSQPSPDNWQAAWGASTSFQLLAGRFGNGSAGGGGGYAMHPVRPSDDRPLPSEAQSFRMWVAPNPATFNATINFALPMADRVRISVYDIAGREVHAIAEHEYRPGEHTITWTGPKKPGLYFVRLTSKIHIATQKIVAVN